MFEYKDDWWRGFGIISQSGMKLREKYKRFDAEEMFAVKVPEPEEPKGCICGEVLKGIKTPLDCSLFAGECTPMKPVGACMVSQEGTCAAWFRFNSEKKYG